MKEYIRGGLSTTKYPLTRAEEAALLKFVKDDTIYSVYYPMIAFMLGTGCRIGEVIGLTWDDIDFENATLSINHQIIYKKERKNSTLCFGTQKWYIKNHSIVR